MRTWVKWTSLVACGLLASSAIAADHADPTETTGVDASDIADLYAWMSEDGKLVMIQTITAAELSDGAYYVFNIGRQPDAIAAATGYATNQNVTKVICWYNVDETTCVVDDGSGATVDYVRGLAADELTSTEGTLRVHVGQHADPFFFYLTGFNQARQEVFNILEDVGGDPDAFDPTTDGCPQAVRDVQHPDAPTNALMAGDNIAIALRGLLNGTFADSTDWQGGTPGQHATNNLGTNDLTAIVVELDPSLLAGSGDIYQVWASTHVRN